ncbi:MAG: hypothetical protein Q7J16_02660 [Candidatus Cloacimonadales bacterium]|nr:hypothetical protein [Candidatus Cloacimonadales bacterium]
MTVELRKNDTIRKLMGENIESTKMSDNKPGYQSESAGLKPPIVQYGVQFELQKCFYSNGIVSFVFNITNLDMDKEISILNYTRDDVLRFFDENGNEYQKAEIFLGTHRAASNREGVSQITMIQDVGTQCIMKFNNVSKKPQTVKRLDLLLEIPDLKNVFTITFRDIPVE